MIGEKSRRPLTWLKDWSGLILSVIVLVYGVFSWFGRVGVRLEDYDRLRETTNQIPSIAKGVEESKGQLRDLGIKAERFSTEVALIRAKINDEIIPRLKQEQKIRPVGSASLGVPVPVDEAVKAKVISEDQYRELSPKYKWVVPYTTVRSGEGLESIVKASQEKYGNATDPAEAAKVNQERLRDPKNIPAGVRVVIPFETLEFRESLQYRRLGPDK